MKAVILAGGLGSRLSEETQIKPKPLVEIGGMPILWHIMKIYSAFGINEFVICLGYKGHLIKEYFQNYNLHANNVTINIGGRTTYHSRHAEDWKISLIDTGLSTQTGGRLRRIKDLVDGDDFCMTYGDGVANVDIAKLVEFHKDHGNIATVTATRPTARFGALELDGNRVVEFNEKPTIESGWINGGFFVLNPRALDYIESDATIWERQPMRQLANDGQLQAHFHDGFWQPMDTLREKHLLEDLWSDGSAPWKIW